MPQKQKQSTNWGQKVRCCGKFYVRFLRPLLHETTAVAYKETWSHLLSAIAATKPKAIAVTFFCTTFSYSFPYFSRKISKNTETCLEYASHVSKGYVP